MVNYDDPVTIAKEFLALVKLWHVVDGIYIWEFLTTLDYEWDVFQGRRPYRWTIWIYSLARISALMAVILNMVGFDTTTPINCQVWVTFEVIFAYTAFAAGALLIVLRIIAIWNMKKIIIAIAMTVWLADVALLIHGIVRLRSVWSPLADTCALLNLEITKASVFGSLTTDILLLLIMLVGLFKQDLVRGNAFGLGRTLWKQGLIWLVIATAAEVPPTIFMILNLNVSMDLMFQTPGMIALSIAATRIHRSLMDYVPSADSLRDSRGRAVSARAPSVIVLPARTEVFVSTERDQSPTTQTSRTSYVSTKPQRSQKAHEVSLDDMERGLEK
ncbi:hypothetical protein BGY98DRAFT_1094577 [Russula aff. rugulosa BPL654]|nr:hypothetical protein BGY98DRAFT_1094577 [Russula aff. rugulosa BPL654]